MLILSEKQREKIFGILCSLFLLAFCWPINVSSWALVAFALVILIATRLDRFSVIENYSEISFFLFYIYITVPFFFLNANGVSSSFISTQIPFIALSVISFFFKRFFQKEYFLKVYAVGVTISLSFLLLYALYIFWDEFYLFKNGYDPVTELIGMHSAYLSLFVSLGFLIILHNLLEIYSSHGRNKLLSFVWLLFLGFGVFYIRSRMGVVSFIIVTGIYLFLKLKSVHRWIAISLFVVLIGLVYLVVSITEFHKGRFQLEQVKSSLEMKKIEWKSSLSIIRNHPLFGVTEVNAQKMLNDEYRKIDFTIGVTENYNSHNQFLTTLMQGGAIGFSMLFGPLFWLLIRGFLKNRTLDVSVAFLIVLSFTTESMLSRHKGVIFYSFFILLFLAEPKPLSFKKTTHSPDSKIE